MTVVLLLNDPYIFSSMSTFLDILEFLDFLWTKCFEVGPGKVPDQDEETQVIILLSQRFLYYINILFVVEHLIKAAC